MIQQVYPLKFKNEVISKFEMTSFLFAHYLNFSFFEISELYNEEYAEFSKAAKYSVL